MVSGRLSSIVGYLDDEGLREGLAGGGGLGVPGDRAQPCDGDVDGVVERGGNIAGLEANDVGSGDGTEGAEGGDPTAGV